MTEFNSSKTLAMQLKAVQLLQMCSRIPALLVIFLVFLPLQAQASELDGAHLSALWGLPFAGLLLSIALWPMLAANFWHHHYGKIAVVWALMFFIPCVWQFGFSISLFQFAHVLVSEYLPFIILLSALFAIAGGISIEGNLHGSPGINTAILGLGTLLASIMGTTGAAMLLIRPLIRANDNRQHVKHVMVFFIFLVANAGGSLTPLGDPPLFLGFLQGVDFLWTLKKLYGPTLFLCLSLLFIFYLTDRFYYLHREEERPMALDPTPDSQIKISGQFNFILLSGVLVLVLMSGFWKSGIVLHAGGLEFALQNLLRDVGLLLLLILSLYLTPKQVHDANEFNWAPMKEVAKLFLAIFACMIPVIAILKAGSGGSFAFVIGMVSDQHGQPINTMYFWMTGILSSFLDNAPTYLVFFNTAGGDAALLMTKYASTLAAISCGAVFMGANSYIGNAPNMMVKAIAEQRGIQMPSFFAYMGWSMAILMPLFALIGYLFF